MFLSTVFSKFIISCCVVVDVFIVIVIIIICLFIFILFFHFIYVNSENVDRPATSTHVVEDLHCPDTRTPLKVLTLKVLPLYGEWCTLKEIGQIWSK